MTCVMTIISCNTVSCYETVSAYKTCDDRVLIALTSRVRSCKCKCYLESCDECVWLEIPILDTLNLLTANHYFPLDTKPEVIINYFRFLENKSDTQNFWVNMSADFNTPGFDWNHSLFMTAIITCGSLPQWHKRYRISAHNSSYLCLFIWTGGWHGAHIYSPKEYNWTSNLDRCSG
jgi:hypothetical protein